MKLYNTQLLSLTINMYLFFYYLIFIIMKRKQTKEEFNRELIDCMKHTMYRILLLYKDYRELLSIYIDIN